MSKTEQTFRFTKQFRGATGTSPFPKIFVVGDECPADLIVAAREAEAIAADDGSQEVDLEDLKKAELEALAAERHVDISKADTKAEIIAALKAAEGGQG